MTNAPQNTELILYRTNDGAVELNVPFDPERETYWLTQAQMANLFGKSSKTINEHIQNIYKEGELEEGATFRKFRIVQMEGEREVARELAHYNLDVIISVGYRVKSLRGTEFRKWATARLREYIVKGFTMDDVRLKHGANGPDYFDELMDRIRDIRTSEKRFYQKVADIFATATDYESSSPTAQLFFKTIQNKMHYAVHGMTASELIIDRIDAHADNMGLTTWDGKLGITKKDTETAKNYLNEPELKKLNLLTTQLLDYAELQAMERKMMTMADWAVRVDKFLAFNEQELLQNAGSVSNAKMKQVVAEKYEAYKAEQAKKPNDYDEFEAASRALLKKKKDEQ